MKYLLIALLLVEQSCLFRFAHGQVRLENAKVQKATIKVGPAAGGGGNTYFLTENFETPTTGYENGGWSTSGGSPNPVYSTSGLSLEGSQCLRLNQSSATLVGLNKSDLYGFMKLRILAHNASIGGRAFAIFYNSTPQFQVGIDGSRQLFISHGSQSATASATFSDTTTYFVWFEYHKGTGANGTASAAISTTSTKPLSGSNFCSLSNGDATVNIIELLMYSDSSSVHEDFAVDMIRLSDSPIGDNPN